MSATTHWPQSHRLHRPLPQWAWLLAAGATAATLDLAFAAAFWWLRDAVPPGRILQTIASWVLGRPAAYAGGAMTAALGALLYLYATTLMAAGYQALARRHRALRQRPWTCGALYGIAMYALLFGLVVPYAGAAGPQREPLAWTLACIVAYALLIGVPCALFARRRLERERR